MADSFDALRRALSASREDFAAARSTATAALTRLPAARRAAVQALEARAPGQLSPGHRAVAAAVLDTGDDALSRRAVAAVADEQAQQVLSFADLRDHIRGAPRQPPEAQPPVPVEQVEKILRGPVHPPPEAPWEAVRTAAAALRAIRRQPPGPAVPDAATVLEHALAALPQTGGQRHPAAWAAARELAAETPPHAHQQLSAIALACARLMPTKQLLSAGSEPEPVPVPVLAHVAEAEASRRVGAGEDDALLAARPAAAAELALAMRRAASDERTGVLGAETPEALRQLPERCGGDKGWAAVLRLVWRRDAGAALDLAHTDEAAAALVRSQAAADEERGRAAVLSRLPFVRSSRARALGAAALALGWADVADAAVAVAETGEEAGEKPAFYPVPPRFRVPWSDQPCMALLRAYERSPAEARELATGHMRASDVLATLYLLPSERQGRRATWVRLCAALARWGAHVNPKEHLRPVPAAVHAELADPTAELGTVLQLYLQRTGRPPDAADLARALADTVVALGASRGLEGVQGVVRDSAVLAALPFVLPDELADALTAALPHPRRFAALLELAAAVPGMRWDPPRDFLAAVAADSALAMRVQRSGLCAPALDAHLCWADARAQGRGAAPALRLPRADWLEAETRAAPADMGVAWSAYFRARIAEYAASPEEWLADVDALEVAPPGLLLRELPLPLPRGEGAATSAPRTAHARELVALWAGASRLQLSSGGGDEAGAQLAAFDAGHAAPTDGAPSDAPSNWGRIGDTLLQDDYSGSSTSEGRRTPKRPLSQDSPRASPKKPR